MLKALGATAGGGTGTVTSVGTGTGLTGGPITTSGNISLANTTVTAGTYGSNANAVQIIVNNQGQITNAVNVAIVIANSSVTGLGSMSYQNANAVTITGGTETNVTYSNVTINSGYANFTTVNVAFSGSSSNIGSLSVGGFQNITADTGIIATFTGNSTTYSYTSLQNKNSSATAYGSYSLYNDTGTAYGDIGITSSTYNYATAGFPNNAFSGPSNLFVQAGSTDLAIGTFTANAVHIIANGNVSITDGITVTSNNRVAIQFEIATKNNAYTLTTTDYTILANANTTPFTLTLPSASTSGTGRHYVIKKIDATANTVTISTTSSQTIDGASTYTINTAYSGVNLQSDGSNWWIIANLNGRNGTAGTF
jgi:trimeric autotransporter adhesin